MATRHDRTTVTAPHNPLVNGARNTSLVLLGMWAVTRAAESGFALWVRHAARTPPQG